MPWLKFTASTTDLYMQHRLWVHVPVQWWCDFPSNLTPSLLPFLDSSSSHSLSSRCHQNKVELIKPPVFRGDSCRGCFSFPYDVNAAKVLSFLSSLEDCRVNKPRSTCGKCLRVPVLTKRRAEEEEVPTLPTVTKLSLCKLSFTENRHTDIVFHL